MADFLQKDFRTEVSRQVVHLISQRKTPWQQTLAAGDASKRFEFPHNAVTGRAYRGGNGLLLMLKAQALKSDDPRWFTAKQVRENGWRIHGGRQGTAVEYWQTHEVKDVRDATTGGTMPVRTPLPKPEAFYGVVFNAIELEGIPEYVPRQFPKGWNAQAEVKRLVYGSGAVLMHDQRGNGYFDPKADVIHVPPKEWFADSMHYYEMVAHELGHWTGHSSRMNRYLSNDRSSESFAKEELRAQIASLYVAVEMGLSFIPQRHDHYQQLWMDVLSRDKHEFFRAARDAEAIAYAVMQLGVDRELEKDQAILEPIQPKVLTSSELFEFQRANPGETPENLAHIYAFGGFAGAISEDKMTVFTRWSDLGDVIQTGSAQELVTAMQGAIAGGVPEHVRKLLVDDDRPQVGTSFELAHNWANLVEARVRLASEFLDTHEMCIADAERVGVNEAVISQARKSLREVRSAVRVLGDEPDKLLESLREKSQREEERRFSALGLAEFSKKPPVASIEGWRESIYEGRTVYTDGRLIDLSGTSPHLIGWAKRAAKDGPHITEAATASVVSSCKQIPSQIKLTLIASLEHEAAPRSISCAVFKREAHESAVYLNPVHVRYFMSKFPGVEFHAGPAAGNFGHAGGAAIKVVQKGEIVGVLMPLSLQRADTAAQIEQYLQRNAAEATAVAHSAEDEPKSSHVAVDHQVLSAKPSPASISGWMHGELDGKSVYMTGELLDLSGDMPAIKCWEQRVNDQRVEVHASTFKRAIAASDTPGVQRIEPIAMVEDSKKLLVAFGREAEKPCVYVNSAYVRYFQNKFDQLEYRVGGSAISKTGEIDCYPSVQVLHQGVLVGVIAPVTIKDRALTPNQVHELLGAKPVASASASAAPKPAEASPEPSRKAVDHVNGFTKGMPPVAANKLKKALGKEVLLRGRVDSVRGHLERWHSQGDLAFTSVQQYKVKPLSHTAFNAASYAEQREHEKRIKAGGKVAVYLVNNHDLGKIAHDYALHLSTLTQLDKRAATDRPPSPDDVTALAEIAIEMGDAEVLKDFTVHFGVNAVEYLRMNPIEQRQRLGNHFAQRSAPAAKKTMVEEAPKPPESTAAVSMERAAEAEAPGM